MTANTTQQAIGRTASHEVLDSRVGIASFFSHSEGQQAVDHLVDHGFPAECVRIVATGAPSAEQVNRLDASWIALHGSIEGAIVGLLLSLMIGLLSSARPLSALLSMAVTGTLGGGAVGLVLRLIGQSFCDTHRDFGPATGMRAERHVVMVDRHLSREASRLLEGPY